MANHGLPGGRQATQLIHDLTLNLNEFLILHNSVPHLNEPRC